jgi:hypothetical protein
LSPVSLGWEQDGEFISIISHDRIFHTVPSVSDKFRAWFVGAWLCDIAWAATAPEIALATRSFDIVFNFILVGLEVVIKVVNVTGIKAGSQKALNTGLIKEALHSRPIPAIVGTLAVFLAPHSVLIFVVILLDIFTLHSEWFTRTSQTVTVIAIRFF